MAQGSAVENTNEAALDHGQQSARAAEDGLVQSLSGGTRQLLAWAWRSLLIGALLTFISPPSQADGPSAQWRLAVRGDRP